MEPEVMRRYRRAAKREKRPFSEWVRLVLDERAGSAIEPAPVEPLAPEEIAGRWLAELPEDVQQFVWWAGNAMAALDAPEPSPHLGKVCGTGGGTGKPRKDTSRRVK